MSNSDWREVPYWREATEAERRALWAALDAHGRQFMAALKKQFGTIMLEVPVEPDCR